MSNDELQDIYETPSSTPDFKTELAAQLSELIPEAVADGKVDVEKLRELLAGDADDDRERFGLFWPGKKRALRAAQEPTTATLKPDFENSKDWDTTENVFIEGDNLEVLKILQKHYHGKIKMIYIDPPYNTGKDFIYPDNFKEGLSSYLEFTKQVDSEGKKLSTNTESEGRYHSNWLNMMYPRLKLARNLLTGDGAIMISINDAEAAHLRQLCDEVFGPQNFVAQFVWNTDGHTDNQFDVKINHEYVLLYVRNREQSVIGHVVDPNTREESNLWKGFAENSITKNGRANPPSEVVLPVGFPCSADSLDLELTPRGEELVLAARDHGHVSRQLTTEYEATYPVRRSRMSVRDGKLVQQCTVFSGWANVNKLRAFIANECIPLDDNGDKLSFYLSDRGVIYYRRERERARNILSVLRNFGTTEKARSQIEAMGIPFQYPKPIELLTYLLKVGDDTETGIVLDFFAGSGTTGHAVLQKNAETGSRHRFILVQLPEPLDESSQTGNEGFRTISELGRKRIEKVGETLQPTLTQGSLDIGFRAYKLTETNFAKWRVLSDTDPEALTQLLLSLRDSAEDGATPDALLAELLLKGGYSLTEQIGSVEVDGLSLRSVGSGLVLAYLDEHVKPTLQQLRAVLDSPDLARFIILEDAFKGDDELKTNLVQEAKARNVEFWTA